MKKIKLGILISGRGSNMQALIEACQDQNFPAQTVCIITNNSEAEGLEIARQEKFQRLLLKISHLILIKFMKYLFNIRLI